MHDEVSPRPVTSDDVFRLKFLVDARLSPDGGTVAYAVSSTEGEKGKEKDIAAIWLLKVGGGEARQLTSGLANDSGPCWSPDGKQIAFISNRGGKAQIYIIPVDGGEAKALTSLPQGVGGGLAWSPDGQSIAFTAPPQVEPRDPAAPYRVTRHVYRFDALGYLDDVAQSIFVVPVGGGEPAQLTRDGCQCSAPLWSPDGQEILYLVGSRPDAHDFRGSARIVNLKGDVRKLVEDWGTAVSAAWTPDGESVVFAGVPRGLPAGTQNKVWIMPRTGGDPVARSASLAYQAGGRVLGDRVVILAPTPRCFVSADKQAAYLSVQAGGAVHVYRVALSGPESAAPVVAGDRSCWLLDMQADKLLFATSTLNNPGDLCVANSDGASECQLTSINADALSGLALPETEHLRFAGRDGIEVEGWLMRPPHGKPPYPTILYIHGGPHAAYGYVYFHDFHMLAGAGYAVLFVNHRASTGYGDSFATAIVGDWGNLDYEDLMAAVDAAVARGLADPDRLGVCGLSGGGNLSCWIVGHSDRFRAAVPENPVTNWVSFYGVSDIGPVFAVEEMGGRPEEIPDVYRRCSPITYAHRCTTPTLMVQGENDYRCPAEQSEQFYAVLKANGCVVEMLRLPNSPHGGSRTAAPVVRRGQDLALLDWFNRYVMGKDAPSQP